MFRIGNFSVFTISHFSVCGDQAVFIVAAFLRFLPLLDPMRVGERWPELNSVDFPFCRLTVPGAAHALLGNDLRRGGRNLYASAFSQEEMASKTHQIVDPGAGRRDSDLYIAVRISNF